MFDIVFLLAAKVSCGLAFSGIIKATAAAGTEQSMGAMWPNIALQQAPSQFFSTIGAIMSSWKYTEMYYKATEHN